MSVLFKGKESVLPRFSLDRRVTVLVLLLTALVVGGVAVTGVPLELFPRGFTPPHLRVVVIWVNAPPREVDDKITVPLQEELATVRGLDSIFSWSRTGAANVALNFKQGTDMDIAYREVRDRIERARREFPDDIEQPIIRKDDISGIPIFVAGVAVDPGLANSYDLIQDEIILPMERADGVASVLVQGLEEKEILIELDRERSDAAGLNLFALAQDLGSDNFTLASGDVRDGPKKLHLRSVARYADLDDLRNRLVSESTRLRDVATVTYAEPDKQYRVRAMSKPAYATVVFKEGDANARDVARRVEKVFEGLKDNPRLEGVDTVVLFNQGAVIEESLFTMLRSGAVGGVIAAIVLFLFLRRLRVTLVICLSIPLSLLIALTVMYFAGETLNILSLLALMVCVGLLVDNSVVVAENIHRIRQTAGLSRRDACVRGAGEIALAITMSTLTTVVVFLPVALVDSGGAEFFLMRLALPISVALLASLGVALVFIPLAVYTTLSDEAPHHAGPVARLRTGVVTVLRAIYGATFGLVARGYERVLGFFLARRLDLVLGVTALFILSVIVYWQEISFVQTQEDEQSQIELAVEMPDNATLEETEAWFLAAEHVVETNAEQLDLEGWFLFHRKNAGELKGWLKNPRTRGESAQEMTQKLLPLLPPKPGMKIFTGNENQGQESTDDSQHVITVNGEDPEQLDKVVKDLEDFFAGADGVLGVRRGFERTPNELGLAINRERAQRLGVNPQIIAGVVGTALRGMTLPRYLAEGKEIPVRVRFQEEDREGLDELASFSVPAGGGGFLPLSSVTDVRMLATPELIVRRNKRLARTITLDLEEDTKKETRKRLDTLAAGIDLPEGLAFGANTSRDSFNDDLAGLQFAALLSIVLIYLLMGFLFESFILPLSIILTIPLASIGVIWIHVLARRDIDFLGAVGLVLLIGVVVNNGIVLIDYVNRLRAEGHSRDEAILLSARRRFRPIMMTAITTIAGLVPLAFAGRNNIGLSYTSFSLTLIGGMTTATLLTLLVVPLFYTLFDDMRIAGGRVVTRALSGRRRRQAGDEARPTPEGA